MLPHTNQGNATERAIRTWKHQFIAYLCTTDKIFPFHLWDRLIMQVNMMLNMLQECRFNPKLSVYQTLEGSFDYNTAPLAPMGCKIIAHI